MYITYKCTKCGTEFMIPTEYVERMEKAGRYIACPFGHKRIIIANKYDSLKDCMKHDRYDRKDRRTVQKGWGNA